jgi:hypothetical protein
MDCSNKQWVVTYGNGNSCVPTPLSEMSIRQGNPELKFEHEGRLFSIEFDNQTDYFAARDSSISVSVMIISAGRNNRVRGTILNKKQMSNKIKVALDQLDRCWRSFTHRGKPLTKEQVKLVLEWGDFYGYTHIGELSDEDVDTVLELSTKA